MTSRATSSTSSRTLLIAALLVTWLVWGSSFVAISVTLESMPPFAMMASRFLFAGTIALTFAFGFARGRRGDSVRPTLRQWRDAAILGGGYIVVGMGASSWATTRLPSSITALLVATAPLWLVVLQLATSRGRSFSLLAIGGVLAGTLGVAVLVTPNGTGTAIDPLAAAVLVVANGVWAAATMYARRADRHRNLLMSVGMQMLAGGAVLAIVSLLAGEAGRVDLAAISPLSGGAWTYLVLCSSLGGFVAYGWLTEHSSAMTASTHAFINPLVAVALGALLLGEQIGARTLIAGVAIVMAVVLLMLGESRVPAATSVSAGQPVPRRRRRVRMASVRAARPAALGRGHGRRLGWSPAPTPSFAARRDTRAARPRGGDGMDALDIDDALDSFDA